MTMGSGATPNATVLVVDDDEDICLVLASLFRRVGLHTLIAHDGAQALRSAAEIGPALVVLDLGLPDVDGLDLLPQLRQLTRARILLLSARAHDDDRMAGLGRGADDYVTKPFANADLLARCLALLGQPASSLAGGKDPGVVA